MFETNCFKMCLFLNHVFFGGENVRNNSDTLLCLFPPQFMGRDEDDIWKCFKLKEKDEVRKRAYWKYKGCLTLVVASASRARMHADACQPLKALKQAQTKMLPKNHKPRTVHSSKCSFGQYGLCQQSAILLGVPCYVTPRFETSVSPTT